MYSVRFQGLLIGRRWPSLVFAVSLLASLSGCDIEWGGASVHLEDPSPPPEEAPPAERAEEAVEIPLPEGPLLWVLRYEGSGGDVLAVPVARLADGVPAPLGFPEPPPDGYRERFDAAFAAAGTELALGAAGHRVGSVVFSGPPRVVDAGCPSAVPASALVLPRAALPTVSFALGPGLDIGPPEAPQAAPIDNRIRTFGPILAEQLLRQGGEDRPFLAQRADLRAVSWAGDGSPAMAATYLINDAIAGSGPSGAATSLFFLARFGPSGYVVDWSEMRTYTGQSGEREIFTWLGATPVPGGRLDLAVRRDGTNRRLVASVDSEDPARGIAWTEGSRCPALEILEIPDAAPAGN
jgi:hypothetical protein